eukprot:TRINITY_DN3821_c0_g1_i3.p1 TRINITY_DN3821_c0_g1~~TRINITY_DN3821_c0_g1_i3.p1  ORF type:complete len:1231 (+),score=166.43 TRINITY_DN3821_c0_g1_i3:72-3695(+)
MPIFADAMFGWLIAVPSLLLLAFADVDSEQACKSTEDCLLSSSPVSFAQGDVENDEDLSSFLQSRAAVSTKMQPDVVLKEDVGATVADLTPLDFCNKSQLVDMHGFSNSNDSQAALESAIMDDVENELTKNSVDQMVKDMFSFYICVRWVPDEVFWNVAKQEMMSDILTSIIDDGADVPRAIAELYQNFKFMPLLCSRNLAVYEEKDDTTYTYFRAFEDRIAAVSEFFKARLDGPVWKGLRHADEAFCNSDSMNSKSCETKLELAAWVNQATSWFGGWASTDFDTKHDKWSMLQNIFRSFKLRGPSETTWNSDFAEWKKLFPYHSFVGKPGGVESHSSPRSNERFMMCFGKRVASEMHRRPAGTHIITDQNSVGCHGMWTPEHAESMLLRMVKFWRPPTCQLAEKSYEMKKQILKMFQRMNEDLFGAIPSMVQDEHLFETGELDGALVGPQPFAVESVEVDGETLYDGTRVARIHDTELTKEGCSCWVMCSRCKTPIPRGSAGTLSVFNGSLQVVWDADTDSVRRSTTPAEFHVVPREYGHSSSHGILDGVGSAVNQVKQSVSGLFNSVFQKQQFNLAGMLSGSLTKWVVCGVANNSSYEELDKWLGTEDEAFQEHVKEAYSKWTGYKAKIPGEECSTSEPMLENIPIDGCSVCEFSELHADHPEKYFSEDGKQEEFLCPLKPPLSPDEQLNVWRSKQGLCLLHMSENMKRQYGWHYHGHHPARRQNDKVPNIPRPEFELTQLLDVSDQPGPQQVSFGRFCTPEELKANPRFCAPPEMVRPWSSVNEMAATVSAWLQGALGVPVGAVKNMIGHYQRLMGDGQIEDKLKQVAMAIGEQSWDALLGIGRLAHSSIASAGAEAGNKLSGSDARHARLESELFGFSHGGDFLHSVSYQHDIGESNTTSNSRQRFRRVAVLCPCNNFDPGLALALRWEWSEMALRVIWEAVRHVPELLEQASPVVHVRGEARLFISEQREIENQSHFTYGAAINPVRSAAVSPSSSVPARCKKEWWWRWMKHLCSPADSCTMTNGNCEPKGVSEWREVHDAKLSREVGGKPVGQVAHSSLKALSLKYFCGPKSAFGVRGGPATQPSSFAECLRVGVKENAARRAKSPWRLYDPDEIVVVVEFSTSGEAQCVSNVAQADPLLCDDGASKVVGLDSHLGAGAKTSILGGEYAGMRIGTGFPTGAVREIFLKPQDVLEVNGMLIP